MKNYKNKPKKITKKQTNLQKHNNKIKKNNNSKI